MAKKKLYYIVEKEIEENEFVTGNKTISVYEIVNNEPNFLAEIECGNEDNSKEKIQEYFDGYGDELTLMQL
jgi:hypothetical protein